jgi:hypothetical protein
MMLRDPIGDGDVKMDDRVGVDDRAEREIEAAVREGGREQPRGKLLSTKEKLLLEKNARRIQRMEKRRKKEEREVLRAWKREAKEAIANGQNVPEMPTLNEEKTKTKNGNSNGDAENGNEEKTKLFLLLLLLLLLLPCLHQRRRLRRRQHRRLFLIQSKNRRGGS